MGRNVVIKIGTQVRYSGGLTIPSGTLPGVLPVFIQGAVDGTDKYAALGWNAGGFFSSLDDVYARASSEFTITSWAMRISSALAAGENLTLRFIIDGTPDATMPLNFTDADVDAIVRADGNLVVAQDSLIAIEGIVGGTLVSKTVRGGSIATRD